MKTFWNGFKEWYYIRLNEGAGGVNYFRKAIYEIIKTENFTYFYYFDKIRLNGYQNYYE